MADPEALLKRREAWAEAYRRTPHGKPVELESRSPTIGIFEDAGDDEHEEESSISDAGGWQKALDSAYYKLTLILAGMPNNTSAIGFLLCGKP